MTNLTALPQRDFLTRRELADRYNVGVRTVDRWVNDGMPTERWSRRLIRFRVAATDNWLDRRAA